MDKQQLTSKPRGTSVYSARMILVQVYDAEKKKAISLPLKIRALDCRIISRNSKHFKVQVVYKKMRGFSSLLLKMMISWSLVTKFSNPESF